MDQKIEKLSEDVADIKLRVSTIEENQNNFNKRLDNVDKRFDEVNTRLNTLTLGFLGIVGILVAGLLTIIGKVVFFPTI